MSELSDKEVEEIRRKVIFTPCPKCGERGILQVCPIFPEESKSYRYSPSFHWSCPNCRIEGYTDNEGKILKKTIKPMRIIEKS